MTTGIYLVSACASAEEFVAAFRRYADRTGLFVPIAVPLPAGRRGQIALTLTDGGVMIEGEAEIIQSSVKPSGLHGRIGMTIRFVEPDEPSKIVIAELEKARLAMKPAPPSVPPRPASVPDSPRPMVPTAAGRIDAANALAECVAIGDVATLRETTAEVPKAGQKFVVPAIPMVGDRPKSPTAPPDALRPKSPSTPPIGIRPKSPSTPPLGILPKSPMTPPEGVRPKSPTAPPDALPPISDPPKSPVGKTTTLGMPVVKPRTPTQAVSVVPPPTNPARAIPADPAPPKPPEPASEKPPRDDPTSPMVMRPSDKSGPTPKRSNPPTTPPSPRRATPVAPMPVARPPAKAAPTLDEDLEATDLAAPIVSPLPDEARKAVPIDVASADSGRAYVGPPPTKPESPAEPVTRPSRSGGMRASEIMAAVHTEDWTMTPDAAEPTVIPVEARGPAIPDPTPAPAPPPSPTGDWTMSADPAAPDGWAAPAKVVRPGAPASTGNPDRAVASDKAFTATVWEDKPTGIGEPLVEIDPTLMEPLKPMPIDDDSEPAVVIAPPPPPLFAPGPMPSSYVTPSQGQMQLPPPPHPHQALPPGMSPLEGQMMLGASPQRQVSDAGTGFFRDSGEIPRYATEYTGTVDKRRRMRLLVIVMSAVLAVTAGFVLVVLIAGGGKKTADARTRIVKPADAGVKLAVVDPGPGSANVEARAPIDAGAPVCSVEVISVPPGADVALDKTALGVAPGPFVLPCGVEAKLTIRKAKYAAATKAVTPTVETASITVKLALAMFTLKVTSLPAGATITVGGRTLGVTPTSIKLPAFATSTVTLTKDGFAPDTEKLTPKSNSTSHHVILKRRH